jgi:hypothetical protein
VTAPSGFAISVPSSWFEIDVHPDTRNAAIGALVSERTRAIPELAPHRDALARALRSAARSAYANGAAYCGAMAEGFDGAVLTASITVSVVRAPGDEGSVESYLRPLVRAGEDSPWREVGQVDLPHVGTVARTRGVEDVVLPEGGGWIRSVLMQTFIPFPSPGPGGGDPLLALVTGSTPILPMADDFLDLFEAITTTFRFVPPERTVQWRMST